MQALCADRCVPRPGLPWRMAGVEGSVGTGAQGLGRVPERLQLKAGQYQSRAGVGFAKPSSQQ